MNVNENVLTDIIDRSRTGSFRKEDAMTDDDFSILKSLVMMYRLHMRYDDCDFDQESFVKYIDSLERDGFTGADFFKLKRYVENNQTEVENMFRTVDECDVAAPNCGITFSDVSGMCSIRFPGLNGEPGSGDLPMPSGKVYQQVAPFSKFIKMKKKKRKKFSKKDEPCAKYTNPPVYNHVDDFRDYVNRTYDIVDKRT